MIPSIAMDESQQLPGSNSSWNPALRPDSTTETQEHGTNSSMEKSGQQGNKGFAADGSTHDPQSLAAQTSQPALANQANSVESAQVLEHPTEESGAHATLPALGDGSDGGETRIEAPAQQPERFDADGPKQPDKEATETLLDGEVESPFVPEGGTENLDVRENVDPDWGFASTLAQNHTNSFPPVPPLPKKAPDVPAHPLPHSQVEEIMEEVEQSEPTHHWDAEGEHIKETTANDDPWTAQENGVGEGGGFFSSQPDAIVPNVPAEPSDAEARYEEGVPLMPHETLPEGATAAESISYPTATEADPDSFFDSGPGAAAAEDDFFSQVNSSAVGAPTQNKPPSLDRKSTNQVLASMDLSQPEGKSVAPESRVIADLNRLTGGGIAVSTRTVASQFIASRLGTAGDMEAAEAPAKGEDLSALWQAALDDDELLEDEPAIDPSSFFDDDGEGFLDDSAQEPMISPPVPTPVHDSSGQLRGFSNITTPSQQSPQAKYMPSSSSSPSYPPGTNFGSQGQSQMHGNSFSPYSSTNAQYGASRPLAAPLQNQANGEAAQSFAAKSKGGYSSPYDAPMDLSRPKRRAATPSMQYASNRDLSGVPPPPRSSSIHSSETSPQFPNQQVYEHSLNATVNAQPPPGAAAAAPQRPQAKPSSSSFFEELPVAPKIRPASTMGRPFAQPAQQPQLPPQGPPMRPGTAPMGNSPPQNFGLIGPQRVVPFADPQQSAPPPSRPTMQASKTMPPVNARYSPAPVQQQAALPNANRYAQPPPPASLPPRAPSISQSLPFLPRTSSPLARSSSAAQQYQPSSQSQEEPEGDSNLMQRRRAGTDQGNKPPQVNQYVPQAHGAPPPGGQYAPQAHAQAGYPRGDFDPVAIDRPQVKQRGFIPEGIPEQPMAAGYPRQEYAAPRVTRPRAPTVEPNFVLPNDGQEHDPLKRWQGAPIFNFGFGGNIVISFPKRIPLFAPGQTQPMIKSTPGEVKVQEAKYLPIDGHIATFPGPLQAKGKKKEVLEWLQKGIQRLEHEIMSSNPHQISEQSPRRREERILLWKFLHLLVEFDGALDTSPAAVNAVRELLSPELRSDANMNQFASYTPNTLSTGITGSNASISKGTADPAVVEDVRKLLLQGEREKAVWRAVDEKMWGHAMLMASTLSKDIWKQVSQEFVKHDVRALGENTESLAALYDVFAGNWEESVDELVPPSARAGFQLVSKTAHGGPAKNALEGLDRWRETLNLILSNRSLEDSRSIIALGQLLSNFGRPEAAHICYISFKLHGLFSGADDPQAAVVLVGADHRHRPSDFGNDLDSILLTEVYEFATSKLAAQPLPVMPHLQSFKLYHAMILADAGYRDEAQDYCQFVRSGLKSTSKRTPYYHPHLFESIEDLESRLKQAPRNSSGSWMSKPSMDKVSGSVWTKFTQFVAGDDSESGSGAAAKADEQGPFARISGGTPSISRGPSPGEYGSAGGYMPASTAAPPTNSRYAPGGMYAPQQHSSLSQEYSPSSGQSTSPEMHRAHPQASFSQGSYHAGGPGSQGSGGYLPTPPSQAGYSPESSLHEGMAFSPSKASSSHISHPISVPPASRRSSSYEPPPLLSSSQLSLTEPRRGSYQASPVSDRSSGSYEPRSAAYAARSSSYGPRSYQPSPSIDEKPLPQAPIEEASSTYEPQVPVPESDTGYSGDPQKVSTPSISQEPPTPTGPAPSFGYEPMASGYEPSAPIRDESNPATDPYSSSPATSGYQPPSSGYEPPSSGYEPPSSSYEAPTSSYAPPTSSYEPPSSSYEPPSSSYEPPSYDPEGGASGEGSADATSTKKGKSIMDISDDDNDQGARAAAAKRQEKAEKDRLADEAFRRAAEADAQKGPPGGKTLAPKASGWLGGWFGGGSKSEDGMGGAGSGGGGANGEASKKPIKARLGEESSFYYDANLKKWINKKADPATQAAATAPTPPPPKGGAGPPSRQASSSNFGGPPPSSSSAGPTSNPMMGGTPPLPHSGQSGPPSRNMSPSTGGGSGLPPGLAPPSRPGTGMSGAVGSDIDDLLGAPAARKGGTVKRAKKGRYVDVMAK